MASLLVVDDEATTLRAMCLLLSDHGHEVRTAAGGQAALQALEFGGDHMDLVILDLVLPGGPRGQDVLAAIRNRWRHLPVVCMTAYSSVRQAVSLLKNGAVDYLEKPFNNDELLMSVNSALEAARFRMQRNLDVQKLDENYGPFIIGGGDGLVERDLEPAARLLTALRRFLVSSEIGPTGTIAAAGLDKYRLVHLVMAALIAPTDVSPPVFWALARGLRTLASTSTRNCRSAAGDIEQMVRNTVELVLHCRRTTRAIIMELEAMAAVSHEQLTIETLSRTLGMDRSHLSRLLKADTGLTFRQWRWAILMKAAVCRLASETGHVGSIAAELGYKHHSQLDRDFSRVFGITPQQFRRLAGARRHQKDV